jgi:hypothetical protein
MASEIIGDIGVSLSSRVFYRQSLPLIFLSFGITSEAVENRGRLPARIGFYDREEAINENLTEPGLCGLNLHGWRFGRLRR